MVLEKNIMEFGDDDGCREKQKTLKEQLDKPC